MDGRSLARIVQLFPIYGVISSRIKTFSPHYDRE
jgi:hypothetical protein